MNERAELLRALRELIELERASGVEAMPRGGLTAPRHVPDDEQTSPEIPAPVATVTSAAIVTPAPIITRPAAAPIRVRESAPAPVEPAAPPAPTGLADADLSGLAQAIAACQRCPRHTMRTRAVAGEGAIQPLVAFIGAMPGTEEDAAGRPFTGPAGQLLDRMIQAMGLSRNDVFLTDAVKCRASGNRPPDPSEIAACTTWLEAQLLVLRPRIICTLGQEALKALFGEAAAGVARTHGRRLDWRGTTVIPTFHPAYLLANPDAKKPAWEDLKEVLRVLGRPIPSR